MNLKTLLKYLIYSVLSIVSLFLIIFSIIYFSQETKELNPITRKELKGSFIKLSKGYVHYQLGGADTGKTVILIHGAGSGYYAWDKNYDFLVENGFRTLRYDLYGRGFSDRPDIEYNPQLFENQLSELIDSLELKPPFTLVSVSMGAIVALNFANKNKDLVEKLVLVDPAALNSPEKSWILKTPLVSDILMTLYWYPRAVKKQMKEFYNAENVKDYESPSFEQLEYKGLKMAMKSTWLYTLNQNLISVLPEINNSNIAVLILWGKYDPLIPPIESKKYLETITNAKFIEIDSAGHLANYERPNEVNSLILEFLVRL